MSSDFLLVLLEVEPMFIDVGLRTTGPCGFVPPAHLQVDGSEQRLDVLQIEVALA